jgi:hypothetical protein
MRNRLRVPNWVVVAFVSAGIGTGWTVAGDVVEKSLPSAEPTTPALVSPAPTATIGEEITDLEQLRDALRHGLITHAEFGALERKVLAQTLGP